MKKSARKMFITSAAAAVSAVVLAGTAFAAASNVSGYEALKQSVFTAIDFSNNATVSVNAELFADGEQVVSVHQFSQTNKEQNASYSETSQFIVGADEMWEESARVDGYHYMAYSASPDTYYRFAITPAFDQDSRPNWLITDNQRKLLGIIMDLFVGDLKNYFVTEGNVISISLSKNQIPELAQSFFAVVAEQAASEGWASHTSEDSWESICAQYLFNPEVNSGALTATLTDDGYPAGIEARVEFSGSDENGAAHNASLILKAAITDVGSTLVNSYDPKGKTLEEPAAMEILFDLPQTAPSESSEADTVTIEVSENEVTVQAPENEGSADETTDTVSENTVENQPAADPALDAEPKAISEPGEPAA
ncbi:MAG: hypothetical protein LBT44_05360 [Clostridiales bacterium]|jgi:hypothetical protein|nr:hypothetical protein [Clostridiales bacterium]